MDWVSIWIVIMVTVLLVAVIIMFVAYCICWEKKKPGVQHFYILEENKDIRSNSLSSLNVFRHLTSSSSLKNHAVFTSDNLPIIQKNYEPLDENESDLHDSMDVSQKFDSSMLRIRTETSSSRKDDMESCISEASSRHSFYSTYPTATRQNSEVDTFVSIEYEDIVA